MSNVSGQEARAARNYLKLIGYITSENPMLWLNGVQLTGIAEQKRRERRMRGIDDVDLMMPPPPSSRPSIPKRKGGKKTKRVVNNKNKKRKTHKLLHKLRKRQYKKKRFTKINGQKRKPTKKRKNVRI